MSGWISKALVENHHDVAAKSQLHVHRALRREEVAVAIQVRAEEHTLVGHFAKAIEAENLKAAGISQDWPGPGHEFVQATQAFDTLMSGAQEQVVRVGEDYFGVQIVDQIARRETFHCSLSAHRHEHRRLNCAMGRMQQTGSRASLWAFSLYFKSKSGHGNYIVA